jgi:hypothetical protein
LHVPPSPQLQSITVPVHVSLMFVHEFAPHVTVGQTHTFPSHVLPPVQPPHATLSPQAFFTVPHFPVQTAGGGGGGHAVQCRIPPHPFEIPVDPGGVQRPPLLAHVSGMHPHVFVVSSQAAASLPHWLVPQLTDTPHAVIVPHLPVQSAAVGGVQKTHWLVFASQICDAPASLFVGHDPQFTGTPHESRIVPHCAPASAQSAFFETH